MCNKSVSRWYFSRRNIYKRSNKRYSRSRWNTRCINIKKPFWADTCSVKECCESKKLECCGKCEKFACNLLESFAYDKENGDNGLRIENCKNWCTEKQ